MTEAERLAEAAQAVIERWDCPLWDWEMEGPTADLIHALRLAIAAHEAAKPEPDLLACDIAPRPLSQTLADYHRAMSEGPLHFTWQDKPHRLVYDLIAAVRYYAAPVAAASPLSDEQIDRVTDAQWATNNHKTIYAALRAYARAIERAHGIKEQA